MPNKKKSDGPSTRLRKWADNNEPKQSAANALAVQAIIAAEATSEKTEQTQARSSPGRLSAIGRSLSLLAGRLRQSFTAEWEDAASAPKLLLGVCALLLGLFSLCTMIVYGYITYTPLPVFDGWEVWAERLSPMDRWKWLFTPFNDHRIPVIRLLYVLDERLSHGDARVLICCTFLAQFGIAVMLYRLARSKTLTIGDRCFLFGLILAFLFAAPQWMLFSGNMYGTYGLVYFLSIAAIIALHRAVSRSSQEHPWISRQWLAFSICMGLAATGTLAHGLAVWPVLIVLALVLRVPKTALAVLCVVSVAVWGAFVGYYHPSNNQITWYDLSLRVPEMVAFVLAFLGSALNEPLMTFTKAIGLNWDAYRITLTSVAGAIGIGWFVHSILALMRNPHRGPQAHWTMLHVNAFILIAAILTSFGRTRFSVANALTSHYSIASVIFWACLVAFRLSRSADESHPEAGQSYGFRVGALFAAFLIGGMLQLPKLAYAADYQLFVKETENTIINNAFEPALWEQLFNSPARMVPILNYFRQYKFSSFSRDWAQTLGDPVQQHFRAVPGTCDCIGGWDGAVSTGKSYRPNAQAGGWAYNRRLKQAPKLLVFADNNHRIAGFSAPTRKRPDLATKYPEALDDHLGWIVYLPGGISRNVTVYALLPDRRSLCRIAGGVLPGTYLTVPVSKAGAVIPNVWPVSEQAWASSLPPGGPPPPSQVQVWSSHDLRTRTGTLRLGPITLRGGIRVGLPIVTGPGAVGMRVSAVERGTHNVIASADVPSSTDWSIWRLEVPANMSQSVIDYIIEDTGEGAGDWIAAGSPTYLVP